MSGNGQLRSLIERIERLEEEKKAIADDIKAVFSEAKAIGFDTKVMRALIRERRLSADERNEQAALLEVYRAAVGMLDGTPLGDAARKRLTGKSDSDEAGEDVPKPEPVDGAAIEAAREAGRSAAKAGAKVFENPFTAGDPRRAAWDEGWCAERGSDGMDIPDAWRRKAKPKKGADKSSKGDGDDGAGA